MFLLLEQLIVGLSNIHTLVSSPDPLQLDCMSTLCQVTTFR